ncbi:RelA/SpoT domain-containing protein [uncultured Hyphomonas sp.]|uniref:RelA/SpoT domain-containing protein n=1 Tax=uncultured Hyphomonas sp. TaxID=225298 RepID=UPI002AABE9C7|nr:RelA/SpoT domain-containing protein [uncultured Hyphomonas sp.]
MTNLELRYSDLHDNYLVPCTNLLREHVAGKFLTTKFIDRVSARAKSVESFLGKATKELEDGSAKYKDPFEQIQDLIGVRIVVFYPQTVVVIDDIIDSYYTSYEESEKHPESSQEFGYEGKHFLLKIPAETLPDNVPTDFPECFELQIKTLFQHAFSEATHDLVYKPGSTIASDQQKRAAYAAASAWGADQVLQQLVEELLPDYPSKEA